MSVVISVRLDEDAKRAIAELEATGLSRSEAVRRGLVEAAQRLRDIDVWPRERKRWPTTLMTERRQ